MNETNKSEILSIIIPFYNEEQTIIKLINKICLVKIPQIEFELILINDASQDNSLSLLQTYYKNNKSARITILNHTKNKGKGAALQTGIKVAQGKYILFQDADLEYSPKNYIQLLEPIQNNKADVVYGSRFLNPKNTFFKRQYIANKVLTFYSNLFTSIKTTDMETGYKVFKSEFLHQLHLKQNRFGIEPEITAKISKLPKLRFLEIPISYKARQYSKGKKVSFIDGLKAFWYISKYNILK